MVHVWRYGFEELLEIECFLLVRALQQTRQEGGRSFRGPVEDHGDDSFGVCILTKSRRLDCMNDLHFESVGLASDSMLRRTVEVEFFEVIIICIITECCFHQPRTAVDLWHCS